MSEDHQRLTKAKRIDENADHEKAIEQGVYQFFGGVSDTTDENGVGPAEMAVRALQRIEEMEARIEELERENAHLRSVVDKLEDIGSEKTSKEQKVAAIVTYADNIHDAEEKGAVTVYPKTITGIVDISRRYAYDLVDDMVQQYEWAHDPAEIDQYGSLEKAEAQKGLLVDIEGVHGESVPVNKFTTEIAAEGGAD